MGEQNPSLISCSTRISEHTALEVRGTEGLCAQSYKIKINVVLGQEESKLTKGYFFKWQLQLTELLATSL